MSGLNITSDSIAATASRRRPPRAASIVASKGAARNETGGSSRKKHLQTSVGRRRLFHQSSNGKEEAIMAHIVTNKCVGCKFTDCVEVCPVACFYELDNQLVIHPDECIDCTACVDTCPVHAI